MAIIGKNIDEAVRFLTQNDLIGMPTETVYGLAGNAFSDLAVSKIFEVKNRPTFDPLIVHTSDLSRMDSFVEEIPEKAYYLVDKFMPGPLTLLLPKKKIIPDLVTSGLESVAVRIPNHPLALALLRQLEFPLAAPSANPFGYISPTNAAHVEKQLGEKIKFILDGGECSVGIESSIVGFEAGEVVVYRKGGLAIESIEKVVGKVRIMEHSSSNPQAPGMLKSHYAPRTPFVLDTVDDWKNINLEKVGFLAFSDIKPGFLKENQLVLSPEKSLNEAAKNLFSYMRILDDKGFDIILTELLPEEGLGRAINDRLRRATVSVH